MMNQTTKSSEREREKLTGSEMDERPEAMLLSRRITCMALPQKP